MIAWLLLHAEMGAGVPPEPAEFLSARELARLEKLRFAKRREEWLLGRYAAKLLVHQGELISCPLTGIEIENEEEGAPYVLCDGSLLPGVLSLSHRQQVALAGWSPEGEALGVDVEIVEPRLPVFSEDYFTEDEKESLRLLPECLHPLAITILWSAKESTLKALRKGLRFDTRHVEVKLPLPLAAGLDWQPFTIRFPRGLQDWYGRWRKWNQYVLTVVVSSPTPLQCQNPSDLQPLVLST